MCLTILHDAQQLRLVRQMRQGENASWPMDWTYSSALQLMVPRIWKMVKRCKKPKDLTHSRIAHSGNLSNVFPSLHHISARTPQFFSLLESWKVLATLAVNAAIGIMIWPPDSRCITLEGHSRFLPCWRFWGAQLCLCCLPRRSQVGGHLAKPFPKDCGLMDVKLVPSKSNTRSFHLLNCPHLETQLIIITII